MLLARSQHLRRRLHAARHRAPRAQIFSRSWPYATSKVHLRWMLSNQPEVLRFLAGRPSHPHTGFAVKPSGETRRRRSNPLLGWDAAASSAWTGRDNVALMQRIGSPARFLRASHPAARDSLPAQQPAPPAQQSSPLPQKPPRKTRTQRPQSRPLGGERRRAAKLFLTASKLFEKEMLLSRRWQIIAERRLSLIPSNRNYALAGELARSHAGHGADSICGQKPESQQCIRRATGIGLRLLHLTPRTRR